MQPLSISSTPAMPPSRASWLSTGHTPRPSWQGPLEAASELEWCSRGERERSGLLGRLTHTFDVAKLVLEQHDLVARRELLDEAGRCFKADVALSQQAAAQAAQEAAQEAREAAGFQQPRRGSPGLYDLPPPPRPPRLSPSLPRCSGASIGRGSEPVSRTRLRLSS